MCLEATITKVFQIIEALQQFDPHYDVKIAVRSSYDLVLLDIAEVNRYNPPPCVYLEMFSEDSLLLDAKLVALMNKLDDDA